MGLSHTQKLAMKLVVSIIRFFFYFREPTYKNDPVSGYHSIQNDEIMALDISNEGLILLSDPRESANEFWSRLEERAQQIMHVKTT